MREIKIEIAKKEHFKIVGTTKFIEEDDVNEEWRTVVKQCIEECFLISEDEDEILIVEIGDYAIIDPSEEFTYYGTLEQINNDLMGYLPLKIILTAEATNENNKI